MFGKKFAKQVTISPQVVYEDTVMEKEDDSRYDNESAINRGEQYPRQRRRSRYLEKCAIQRLS